jgi:phosphoglycerate dehydrogenase-like enzyme
MRVAVLDDYQQVARTSADWAVLGPDVEVDFFADHLDSAAELVEWLAGYQAVVIMRERTPFPAELLNRLPDLRLLVTTGPFNAVVDVAAARDRGITVCGTGGSRQPTVELTWALILALARRVETEDRAIRAGRWQTTLGFELAGKTLGLAGLGHIGTEVARIGRAFGMTVIAWSENLRPEQAEREGVRCVGKAELFAQADLVSVHLVLSERTRGVVGAAELAQLGPQALLVNTSRGPLVDEAALVEALQSRRIGGAALDVYDREPLVADHPLRELDNVVLTPHIGYVTQESYQTFFTDAVDDIRCFRAGQPVRVIEP